MAALLGAARAEACDAKAARQHYIRAVTAHSLGKFDEAAREFYLAYQAREDVALLYNIADSHRRAGRWTDALRFYRMYLVRLPRADERDEAQARLHEMTQRLAPQPSPAPKL